MALSTRIISELMAPDTDAPLLMASLVNHWSEAKIQRFIAQFDSGPLAECAAEIDSGAERADADVAAIRKMVEDRKAVDQYMKGGAMIMTWKQNMDRFSCGQILQLGKWRVGSTQYDSARPKGTAEKWRAHCLLPGVKSDLGAYETEEEAKSVVEKAVKYWMAKATEGAQ